jgi:hypothetical protein
VDDPWEGDYGHDFVVARARGAKPGAKLKLVLAGPSLLTYMSPPSGSIPDEPPVSNDGTWKCSAFGLLIPNGYVCEGEADGEGRATVVIETKRLLDGVPFNVKVQVETATDEAATRIPVDD